MTKTNFVKKIALFGHFVLPLSLATTNAGSRFMNKID
jgi:hypothetical protein